MLIIAMRNRAYPINFNSFKTNLSSKILSSVFTIISLVLCGCSDEGFLSDSAEIHDVEFTEIHTSEPDSVRILKSLKREGDLFMITYYGDYQLRLDSLKRRIVKYGIGSVIPKMNYKHLMSGYKTGLAFVARLA